jgi:hypothetical protein
LALLKYVRVDLANSRRCQFSNVNDWLGQHPVDLRQTRRIGQVSRCLSGAVNCMNVSIQDRLSVVIRWATCHFKIIVANGASRNSQTLDLESAVCD